ncbi:MAG: hypothetical protein QW275_00385 [Candidatus Anstonellaceae archaeon]
MDRKLLLMVAVAIALLVFGFGCTSASKYAPCCKRTSILNVSELGTTVLQYPTCVLQDGRGYGPCKGGAAGLTIENFSSGVAFCQPSYCSGMLLEECNKMPGCLWKGGASGSCQTKLCSDIKEKKECEDSLCFWNAAALPPRCEAVAEEAHTQMPICVDDTPQQCINERCTVMLCGYRTLRPSPPPSSQDWQEGKQVMPLSSKPPSINLKETSCTFKPMNQKTYNAVKNSKGNLWANAFRFGVGNSFSDFEEARYFFPISDRFCTANFNPNAKDRYVVYRTASATWCAPYYSSYYQCSENNLNFTDLETCKLWCKNEANCQHTSGGTKNRCLESGFLYNDADSCRKECPVVKNPQLCPLDSSQFPFLLGNGFRMTDEGHSGYYRIDTKYYDDALTYEYLPAGARMDELAYFECDDDYDCISGYCSYDQHVRGRCLHENGSWIDCGCYTQYIGNVQALNCSDALKRADGSKYTVFSSTVLQNFEKRSQGNWQTFTQTLEESYFNPYWNNEVVLFNLNAGGNPPPLMFGAGTFNEVEKVEDILIGESRRNVGNFTHKVYRFYVEASGPNDSPNDLPKIFKNCEIPRSNKTGIYQQRASGKYGSAEFQDRRYGPIPDLSDAGDGLGPRPQKFCYYTIEKKKPEGGCLSSKYGYAYEAAILPTDPSGGCPNLGGGAFEYFGTGKVGSFACTGWNRYYQINAIRGIPKWYWVYEIEINETTKKIGKCNLSNTYAAPYFNVKNVGWCEGCTYATLAMQKIEPSQLSDEYGGQTTAEKYLYRQMPLYLQANVMPVLDVQTAKTKKVEDGYWYYDPNDEYYHAEWITTLIGTFYQPVDRVCKEVNGAILYVVANDSMASDNSVPSSASNYGSAYYGNEDVVIKSHNDIVNGYLNGHVVCEGNTKTCYLNGRAATIWRALTLKYACENPPLVGMEIVGFATQSEVTNSALLRQLIGNESNPGRLFSFFYTDRDRPVGELGRKIRIAKGTPDSYPDKIDVLMQSWHPTCQVGGDEDEKIKYEFNSRINFSRALLSNFSKPSLIWKFHFPTNTQCNKEKFMEYLFRHKGDLVDAGIIGLIYDNWKGGEGALQTLSGRSGTPFCAVQNHSRKVLGIATHTYGQKLYAANGTCVCERCTTNAYSTGVCNSEYTDNNHPAIENVDQLMCNDGTRCTLPLDENDNPVSDYWNYFCPQICVNYDNCASCTDPSLASATAFCRIEAWSGVWKTNKPYSAINDQYWDILSALPAKDKCCIEKEVEGGKVKYTYVKKESATQRSELLQFPRRGEEGIDCGRTPDTSFLKYCDIEVPIDEKKIACWKVG